MFDVFNFIYLSSSQIGYLWLVLALILLLLEVGTPGLFFFIAFSISCIITSPLAFLDFNLQIQCITFIIMAIISFSLLKKIFSIKNKTEDNFKTNIFALVGQKVIIIKDILPNKIGYVKVKGDLLPAKSDENEEFKSGQIVVVIRIEGNCLVVGNY